MRSPSSVPPGSRVATTLRPSPRSASASSSACVDLPLPSIPSKVTNTPREDTVAARRTNSVRGVVVRPDLRRDALAHGDDRRCAVAALELAVLCAIGVTVLGKSVAHRVQTAAICEGRRSADGAEGDAAGQAEARRGRKRTCSC